MTARTRTSLASTTTTAAERVEAERPAIAGQPRALWRCAGRTTDGRRSLPLRSDRLGRLEFADSAGEIGDVHLIVGYWTTDYRGCGGHDCRSDAKDAAGDCGRRSSSGCRGGGRRPQ
jgi:hypothetical protein